MALNESWHLRSRGRECAATQQPFQDGEAIITALFPDPDSSGYLRRDFAMDAWKSRSEDAEKPFSFWRGIFTATLSHERPDVVEREGAEDLFRRLVDEEEEHTENTRYILAVMLERQKLLRETDNQRTNTGILRVYEHRKTGEVFIIRDPDIPLADIEAVQTEVIELLENGGRPRPPQFVEEPPPTEPDTPPDAAEDTLPDRPDDAEEE